MQIFHTKTAHSALKLATSVYPMCNVSKGSSKAKLLIDCKIIVWGECTMAHKKSLEALNHTLKDLTGKSQIMGGKLVILAGDFRHTACDTTGNTC